MKNSLKPLAVIASPVIFLIVYYFAVPLTYRLEIPGFSQKIIGLASAFLLALIIYIVARVVMSSLMKSDIRDLKKEGYDMDLKESGANKIIPIAYFKSRSEITKSHNWMPIAMIASVVFTALLAMLGSPYTIEGKAASIAEEIYPKVIQERVGRVGVYTNSNINLLNSEQKSFTLTDKVSKDGSSSFVWRAVGEYEIETIDGNGGHSEREFEIKWMVTLSDGGDLIVQELR